MALLALEPLRLETSVGDILFPTEWNYDVGSTSWPWPVYLTMRYRSFSTANFIAFWISSTSHPTQQRNEYGTDPQSSAIPSSTDILIVCDVSVLEIPLSQRLSTVNRQNVVPSLVSTSLAMKHCSASQCSEWQTPARGDDLMKWSPTEMLNERLAMCRHQASGVLRSCINVGSGVYKGISSKKA